MNAIGSDSADLAPEPGTPRLTVGRYRMEFRARRTGTLPDWLGSTWRGAMGSALKKSVCVTGLNECQTCPVFERCPHAYIFETPPKPDCGKMRKYSAVPHPYVLLPGPGGRLRRGQAIALEYRLFGTANEHRRLVALALERSAWQGLGRGRLSLESSGPPAGELLELTAAPAALPPVLDPVRIEFLRPLRIRVKNRYPGPEELEFGDFFSILLRRISMLCTFHQRQPFEADFRALVDQARQTEWSERRLSFQPLKRRSSRQGRTIDMSGLIGTLELGKADAQPFWPWLWLGQHTLIGRGCVMGLGEYRITG